MRRKSVVRIDVKALVKYLSGLNVAACSVSRKGHVYVVLHQGPGRMSRVLHQEAEAMVRKGSAGFPDPALEAPPHGTGAPFMASSSVARSPKRLVSLVTGIPTSGRFEGEVERAVSVRDVAGHADRIRDQAILAVRLCATERRGIREDAVRKAVRDMLEKSGAKFGLPARRVLSIIREEVDVASVKDVMGS